MRVLRFNGRDRFGKNDNVATPPLAGVWHIGDERVFDRPFAEEHGRVCGEKCTGDCFAEMHAAAWNIGHEKQNPPPFEVRSHATAKITPNPNRPKRPKRTRKPAPKIPAPSTASVAKTDTPPHASSTAKDAVGDRKS